jgi:predicted DNA-binding transcriptional regulator YafY
MVMSNAIRLIQLSQILSGMTRCYSLEYLAQRLDCSPRTLRRDINKLAQDVNAPWVISGNKVHWAHSKHEKIHLAGYWFSTAELQAMLVFYNSLKHLQHGMLAEKLEPYKQHIETLLSQQGTTENLSQKIKIIEIATSQLNPHIFNTLGACRTNQSIKC